ncbi:LPXTG cell wall anchor domain-containing protein [Enterococcus faecalis]|uniref:LPXTG cell wall anchor domain-containing protein n=1 Tax=Enterococcus faecalis TaxID=1351 RepID=UPI003CC513F6
MKKIIFSMCLFCGIFLCSTVGDATSSSHVSQAGIVFNGYEKDNPSKQKDIQILEIDDSKSVPDTQRILPSTNTIRNTTMLWMGIIVLNAVFFILFKKSKNLNIIGGKQKNEK